MKSGLALGDDQASHSRETLERMGRYLLGITRIMMRRRMKRFGV